MADGAGQGNVSLWDLAITKIKDPAMLLVIVIGVVELANIRERLWKIESSQADQLTKLTVLEDRWNRGAIAPSVAPREPGTK